MSSVKENKKIIRKNTDLIEKNGIEAKAISVKQTSSGQGYLIITTEDKNGTEYENQIYFSDLWIQRTQNYKMYYVVMIDRVDFGPKCRTFKVKTMSNKDRSEENSETDEKELALVKNQ